MTALRGRTARLQRVLAQAGPSDQELAEVLKRGRATERQSAREGVIAVAQREVTEAEIDEMYAVLSADVYLLLTQTCGWTDGQYETWVATAVVRLLNLQGE